MGCSSQLSITTVYVFIYLWIGISQHYGIQHVYHSIPFIAKFNIALYRNSKSGPNEE